MNSLTVRRAVIAYAERLARNIAPERARIVTISSTVFALCCLLEWLEKP